MDTIFTEWTLLDNLKEVLLISRLCFRNKPKVIVLLFVAFGKSRSFQLDDVDHCQTFEVVFPFEIRQAFQVKYKSRYNQKLAGKAYNTSIISNPIP